MALGVQRLEPEAEPLLAQSGGPRAGGGCLLCGHSALMGTAAREPPPRPEASGLEPRPRGRPVWLVLQEGDPTPLPARSWCRSPGPPSSAEPVAAGRGAGRRGAPREGAAAPQGELRELPPVRGGGVRGRGRAGERGSGGGGGRGPGAGGPGRGAREGGAGGPGPGAGGLGPHTRLAPRRKRALRKMQPGPRQGEVDWENTTGSDNTDTEGS